MQGNAPSMPGMVADKMPFFTGMTFVVGVTAEARDCAASSDFGNRFDMG